MNKTKLDNISPDKITRNPDNPRLIFREDELNILLNSISKVGIRVPLSVYEDKKKNKYVLLDGERRWICSKKLNLNLVPAVIEPEPSKLENILRMFNIHNVRVQWDLLAIALKIREVQNLLKKEGKPHSVKDLAGVTGVSQSTVTRAFDLLELPQKYIDLLIKELQKPKPERKYTEDFFIEMMKALNAIERHTPQVLEKHPKSEIMDKFVKKYESGVIKNMVRFRDLSKIARAEKAGIKKEKAIPIINKLIEKSDYTIEKAYEDSVAKAYEKRSLVKEIDSLTIKLDKVQKVSSLEEQVLVALSKLYKILKRLLG